MKLNILSLLMVFGLLGISSTSNSQDVKLNRQERREVRKAQMTANFYSQDSVLNDRAFVLEADFLQDTYGQRIPVVSNVNFIKVNKTTGVLQTGSGIGIGYNGVGGVTAEGLIGTWQINKDVKRLSHTLHFSLLTNIGHYDVFMVISADNHATATISGLGPGKLTWEGELRTIYNSRVFKGQNTI